MSDVKRYWVPTLPGRLTRDCVEVVTARDHVAEVERLKTLHVKQLSEVVERMADDHCVVVERLRGLLHDWREQWGDGMHPDGDLIDATDAALAGAAVQPSVVPRCKRCGDTGWLPGDPILGISEEPCGCDENWEE